MYGLPKRSGKLKDLSKFDASFFGVHPKQANSMDPQLRILLEVTYEAIIDAGLCCHFYLFGSITFIINRNILKLCKFPYFIIA
jgi:hypothetical protein